MVLYDNTKVTVELRELIESGVNIWDFEYPSFYEGEEKKAFEQKVIDHFYFRQIGQETPARWLHYFRTRMREIMPYYIDIYKSVELFKAVEDPLESYNLTETYTETGTGSATSSDSSTSETSGSNTSENVRKHSDAPQGSITNVESHISDGTITDDTNTSETDTSVSSSGTSSTESERSYELNRRGNIGVQPLGQEIKILREAYINVDMMVIDDLNDLFLKVY